MDEGKNGKLACQDLESQTTKNGPLLLLLLLLFPLPVTARKRARAVDQASGIYTHHAHLDHGRDKSSVPRSLAPCKLLEGLGRSRVACNVLVRL